MQASSQVTSALTEIFFFPSWRWGLLSSTTTASPVLGQPFDSPGRAEPDTRRSRRARCRCRRRSRRRRPARRRRCRPGRRWRWSGSCRRRRSRRRCRRRSLTRRLAAVAVGVAGRRWPGGQLSEPSSTVSLSSSASQASPWPSPSCVGLVGVRDGGQLSAASATSSSSSSESSLVLAAVAVGVAPGGGAGRAVVGAVEPPRRCRRRSRGVVPAAIAVGVGLVGVGGERAVVGVVGDAVAVVVGVIAAFLQPSPSVSVPGVGAERAVVGAVERPCRCRRRRRRRRLAAVAVGVRLVGVRDERAVVGGVGDRRRRRRLGSSLFLQPSPSGSLPGPVTPVRQSSGPSSTVSLSSSASQTSPSASPSCVCLVGVRANWQLSAVSGSASPSSSRSSLFCSRRRRCRSWDR